MVQLGLRLPAALRDWVQSRGGPAFVRALIERARNEED